MTTTIKWRNSQFEKDLHLGMPPFGKILIGLQLPDTVILVKLVKIDETGSVFVRADLNPEETLVNIFSGNTQAVKVDMVGEFTLPQTETI
jgi:hypothetical protein